MSGIVFRQQLGAASPRRFMDPMVGLFRNAVAAAGRRAEIAHFTGRPIMQFRFIKVALLFTLGALMPSSVQAQNLLPLSVELGDVSLTKLPFVMAVEAGLYRRNGLEVKQFITPAAHAPLRHRHGVI